MKILYTVGFFKVCGDVIDGFEFKSVNVNGEKMNVYFCKRDGHMFVIAGKYRKCAPHRSCGHWHSGNSYIDVYYRKDFDSKKEGNEFFKKFKSTMTI